MNLKTRGLVALMMLTSALVAAAVTLVMWVVTTPEAVQAAPPHDELRIAVVNLERVSRSSPRFQTLKKEWDAAQAELKLANAGDEAKYKELVAAIQRGYIEDPEDSQLWLRSEAQAIEQKLEIARKEHEEYLETLLSLFQGEVLADVLVNVRRYARQQGFRLVLQDYDVTGDEADFFSGFAQSIMSKPVLDAPYALEGDKHVTDITQVMITFMRAGGVPEKKD